MPLHLDVFDVGQGDGALLTLPDGKLMMVDLGTTKNADVTMPDLFKYLKDHSPFGKGTQTLEWLILTHGDRDHYNLVDRFLQAFPVNVNHVMHGGDAADYGQGANNLIRKLNGRANPSGGTPIVQKMLGCPPFWLLYQGQDAKGTTFEITVLAASLPGDTNTGSVVLRVVYMGCAILLTGDATCETERAILGHVTPPVEIKADVLKVAHHGSRRKCNSVQFMQQVNPQFAFISTDRVGTADFQTGRTTSYRLPQALTVDLLLKHAPRLTAHPCPAHSYVVGYFEKDYDEYNKKPDIQGDAITKRAGAASPDWIQDSGKTDGIFSTLATMGPTDPDADQGVQYRFTITDQGEIEVGWTPEKLVAT